MLDRPVYDDRMHAICKSTVHYKCKYDVVVWPKTCQIFCHTLNSTFSSEKEKPIYYAIYYRLWGIVKMGELRCSIKPIPTHCVMLSSCSALHASIFSNLFVWEFRCDIPMLLYLRSMYTCIYLIGIISCYNVQLLLATKITI